MKNNLDHILIFKTNVNSEACKEKLSVVLDQVKEIIQWNLALDDCDRVLRIVSYELKPQEIIKLVTDNGHECHELI